NAAYSASVTINLGKDVREEGINVEASLMNPFNLHSCKIVSLLFAKKTSSISLTGVYIPEFKTASASSNASCQRCWYRYTCASNAHADHLFALTLSPLG